MASESAELAELKKSLKKIPAVYDFLAEVTENIDQFPMLFEIIRTDPGFVKYHCEKIIRLSSEKNPSLVYPFFDEIASLLDSNNDFIRRGAIITVANLAAVDDQARFERIFDQYFSMLDDPSMITAAHVIDGAWKLIRRFPELEPEITDRLLDVRNKTYMNRGKPSTACRDILYGNLLNCFGNYFPVSQSQDKILDFAQSLGDNPRKSVAKKAARFLERFGQP